MVVSVGSVASAAQGASYYERDGYYTKDDPEHLRMSAWAGRGAAELGLEGNVDPEAFKAVLRGEVPDGSGQRLGRMDREGNVIHRPGRDLTFSAPKSVSLAALVGGDERRIVEVHRQAVAKSLSWVEKNAAETRLRDPATGRLVRAGNQKTVVATFLHDTSRNLDPQLHTHAVLANMVRGEDGKWRTMANEGLYRNQKLIGMIYRSELARGLMKLGYGIEKTHADGRFEIAGISRRVIEAFSTRRAEIEAAVAERAADGGGTAGNQRLAERAALMTRVSKRDVDKDALREHWREQAKAMGFDANALTARAVHSPDISYGKSGKDISASDAAPGKTGRELSASDAATGKTGRAVEPSMADIPTPASESRDLATEAIKWAVAHLAERDAVFSRSELLAAALSWKPGTVSVEAAERAVEGLRKENGLYVAPAFHTGDGLTTDRALADERETIGLMREGQGRGRPVMRSWTVSARLHKGPLTEGQKEAVKLILSTKDRVVGVQGYAGTGKTTMLNRARALAEKQGYRMAGLAPSASAAGTLGAEAGIESETLQMFLARNAGVAEGRLTRKGERELREKFKRTVLVVDEGSLASTVQARNLLRIAKALRIPRVVLVGDSKQLEAVDAGKPFAQLQQAGMRTAVMDEILRQRDPDLKAAVEASLAGDVEKAFGKLGDNIAEVKADNIAGAVAARWLRLSPEERERTGVMAPSHELRKDINGHIRERLEREGRIHGPAFQGQRLVSQGFTNAEKALPANYAPGDVVALHRTYRRIGIEKGDERRVVGVDREAGKVMLEGPSGNTRQTVGWEPEKIGGKTGGAEVYKAEGIELRAGDRIRWTRNDRGLGLFNSRTAEVTEVGNGRVSFQLEDGRRLELGKTDPQLRHLDHAWASTVHAFQGRTVDNVIAAMEAGHPNLTTQKSFYVEISRARDRAELVTDDRERLKEQLEAATGERISALEGITKDPEMSGKLVPGTGREESTGTSVQELGREMAKPHASKDIDRDYGL